MKVAVAEPQVPNPTEPKPREIADYRVLLVGQLRRPRRSYARLVESFAAA